MFQVDNCFPRIFMLVADQSWIYFHRLYLTRTLKLEFIFYTSIWAWARSKLHTPRWGL
jgi:hypothetical protein